MRPRLIPVLILALSATLGIAPVLAQDDDDTSKHVLEYCDSWAGLPDEQQVRTPVPYGCIEEDDVPFPTDVGEPTVVVVTIIDFRAIVQVSLQVTPVSTQ
jgi:hypothetical protein